MQISSFLFQQHQQQYSVWRENQPECSLNATELDPVGAQTDKDVSFCEHRVGDKIAMSRSQLELSY